MLPRVPEQPTQAQPSQAYGLAVLSFRRDCGALISERKARCAANAVDIIQNAHVEVIGGWGRRWHIPAQQKEGGEVLLEVDGVSRVVGDELAALAKAVPARENTNHVHSSQAT